MRLGVGFRLRVQEFGRQIEAICPNHRVGLDGLVFGRHRHSADSFLPGPPTFQRVAGNRVAM